MKVLVTGGSGFMATHLMRRLLDDGVSVEAWSRGPKPDRWTQRDALIWRQVDLTHVEAVEEAMAEARPDRIYHLSAQCLPRVAWEKPIETFESNILGTVNLLQAIQRSAPSIRLILISSSSIYSTTPDNRPIREDDYTAAASLYSVSKMGQEMTARLWAEHYGAPELITVRPFFIIGPGKTGDVCSDLARRVVRAERTGDRVIRVGNLTAVRDFLDIDDAVNALCLLAEKGDRGGIYNLSSGSGWAVQDVLDFYKECSTVPLDIQIDQALMRTIDEPVKIGDSSKLQSLGWAPSIPVEESLRRILAYWREQMDE